MGVIHFYTWLVNRYPLIKSPYNPSTLPIIDWLFIDLNTIVYKCTQESSIFKGVMKAKKLEDICIQIFNCVNEIAQLVGPQKILFLSLDGVPPKAKMNIERGRRLKTAEKYQKTIDELCNLQLLKKEDCFNPDLTSPGTEFMDEINSQVKFLIQTKMKEDERWRKLSIIFSGVNVPGENETKILEFIRKKTQEPNFNPNTTICISGTNLNWIPLALSLHLPFVCLFREQFYMKPPNFLQIKTCQPKTFYDFLWINVLRDYFEAEFSHLKEKFEEKYNTDRIIDDFVFLYLLLQNDFLPRLFCMDINLRNFERIIEVFKRTIVEKTGPFQNKGIIDWKNVFILLKNLAENEIQFIQDKFEEQQAMQKTESFNRKEKIEEIQNDDDDIQSNTEVLQEVKELKEEYEELEKQTGSSESDEEDQCIIINQRNEGFNSPQRFIPRKSKGKKLTRGSEIFQEDLDRGELENFSDSTSKSDNENFELKLNDGIEKNEEGENEEEDKEFNEKSPFDQSQTIYSEPYTNESIKPFIDETRESQDAEEGKQEENISQLLSSAILENDIRFISTFLKAYARNPAEANRIYYEEKFRMNIVQDPSLLSIVLLSYLQGLQFVMRYYYTTCPSWQWSYQYDYAPLLSDFQSVLSLPNLPQIISELNNFHLCAPFELYKYLLFVLPPTSMNLIPESLRITAIKTDSNSSKFFPQEFQFDHFGEVFSHESVPKIPVIDEKLLESEYRKALKLNKLTEKEIHRNQTGENLVFEWNTKIKESNLESTLPQYFGSIKVQIDITPLKLEPLNPSKVLDKPLQNTYKYHKSFPYLHFIPEKTVEMQSFAHRNATFYRCCFKIGQRRNFVDYKQYRKLLDQPFYCMYPFLVPCFVMGIVTPDQLITNVDYQKLPFSYKKAYHRDYYSRMSQNVHPFYFMQMGILFMESFPNFALVYLESEPRKDSFGNIFSPKPRIETIPLNFLIDIKIMPNYLGKVFYTNVDITKEFPPNKEVIINIGPPAGSLAQVVKSTREAYELGDVEVKILKAVPKLDPITSGLASKYNDHRKYRSLFNVSKKLGVDLQVIFTVLDCLLVKTEVSMNKKSLYPERFDVGLNLIRRKIHAIVPELVICNELRKFGKSRNRTFPHFQLSPDAVVLVENYYKNHKPLFDAIANKIRLKDPTPLTAKFIFPNAEDPNLELFQIYCWILEREGSSLSLTNKASKVIPREGVQELEKVLAGSQDFIGDQSKNIIDKIFPYNPNFIIPKYNNNWIPPFFSRQPPWHKLGDRVVNLKVNGYNFAPFGATGTVVGILGNQLENGFLKFKIEILFDSPFIGGTNLGGRCSWGRGAIVNFDDVLNLNRWEKCVKPRDLKKVYHNSTWDGVFPKSYLPSFQTSSEYSETEEEFTRQHQAKIKTHQIHAEDLVKLLSAKKKQAEIETKASRFQQQRNKNESWSQSRNQNANNSYTQKPNKEFLGVPKTLGLRPSLNSSPTISKQSTQDSERKTIVNSDFRGGAGGQGQNEITFQVPSFESRMQQGNEFQQQKSNAWSYSKNFNKTKISESQASQKIQFEKNEGLKKGDNINNTKESIKDLGQRFFISFEKETKKNKTYRTVKDTDMSEVEGSQKIEISVVSQGGKILEKEVYFENSEQEIGS